LKLLYMLPDEIRDAQARSVPLVMPAGTIEYHSVHCAVGCDSLIAEGLVERLAARKEIVIAPSIYYGPSSYGVAGPEKGTIHVNVDHFEKHAYDVLKGFLYTGWRNIHVVIHHQFENETLLPMSLCFLKPAKQLTFEFLEDTRGRGWWGQETNAQFYDQLGEQENPWNWINVLPAMSARSQKATGYDHAGKWESSLLMALYPEAVDLRRLTRDVEWYARGARAASPELGRQMIQAALEDLNERIRSGKPLKEKKTL
jgi:creatinine amidohydrolase/Fe(II)-dependent formamide hydrolase-like protein